MKILLLSELKNLTPTNFKGVHTSFCEIKALTFILSSSTQSTAFAESLIIINLFLYFIEISLYSMLINLNSFK